VFPLHGKGKGKKKRGRGVKSADFLDMWTEGGRGEKKGTRISSCTCIFEKKRGGGEKKKKKRRRAHFRREREEGGRLMIIFPEFQGRERGGGKEKGGSWGLFISGRERKGGVSAFQN